MLLYRLILTLAAPILALLMFVRVLRQQESFRDFLERIGFWRALPSGEVIWLHGASNGEMTSARKLIEGILERSPSKTLVLSCNSVSAKKMMLVWDLENTHIRLAPLDLRWIYSRLFKRLSVEKFIMLEADFWLNRLMAAQSLEIPNALIAGRLSKKSARVWQRFSNLSKQMFATFDLVCPQDQSSRSRLIQLGVRPSAIGLNISLKSLHQGTFVTRNHTKRSKFWLAASTHEGEDDVLLEAHLNVQKSAPDFRMILVPRHPKRGNQIAKLARSKGLNVSQRSKGDTLSLQSDIYIADTLGEMETWYEAAAICFVAGSLAAKGGHTPFEPVSYDCAILHGPNFENFPDAYAALRVQGGAVQCRTADEIATQLLILREEQNALRSCVNARDALSNSDAIVSVLDALSQLSKVG